MRWPFLASCTATLGLVAACGGNDEAPALTAPGDASTSSGGSGTEAGGAGGGGVSNAGGRSAGGAGQSGGAPGTGAAGGAGGASGGAPGAGGAASDAGACAPPGPGETAVCLTLVPENVTAETDPAFDEQGVLVIQIFSIPNPPDGDAAAQLALVQRVVPRDAQTGGEVALVDVHPIRLTGPLPATVYIRVIFFDDPALLAGKQKFGTGAWIGGVDLSQGLKEGTTLLPVNLTVGAGNAVSLDLIALRRLVVTVHTSATPLGDGQGPLAAIVVNDPDPGTKPPAFGLAQSRCADVSNGDVTLTGVVVGSGPYWITGTLQDLTTAGNFPPGTLAAITPTAGGATIPKQLNPGTDYTVRTSIDLSFVVPLPADAGPIGPNACTDLVPVLDGGADAGP